MNKTLFVVRGRTLRLLIIVAALLLIASSASAKVRTDAMMPYYARIERDGAYHTDEWAAIVFYRPPECVPDAFDLLVFFDFAAFECAPPTVDGFMVWAGDVPSQANLHGLGDVPVWFVAWPELEAAMEDDILTMSDLEGMESLLVGSASFYKETIHPYGGAQVPMLNYVAHGTLSDGRSFQVNVTWAAKDIRNVRIEFK
jgi:hypothetical protein